MQNPNKYCFYFTALLNINTSSTNRAKKSNLKALYCRSPETPGQAGTSLKIKTILAKMGRMANLPIGSDKIQGVRMGSREPVLGISAPSANPLLI